MKRELIEDVCDERGCRASERAASGGMPPRGWIRAVWPRAECYASAGEANRRAAVLCPEHAEAFLGRMKAPSDDGQALPEGASR